MDHIFEYVFFANATVALLVVILDLNSDRRKTLEGKANIMFGLCSMLWSISCGIVTNEGASQVGVYAFDIGMFFAMLFFVSELFMLAIVGGLLKKLRLFIIGMLVLLIPMEIMLFILADYSEYHTRFGYALVINNGATNLLVMTFIGLITVSTTILEILILIKKNQKRRTVIFVSRFIAAMFVIVAAYIPGQIWPQIFNKYPPLNVIFQFYSYMIIYFTMLQFQKNKLTVDNMSEFMFRSLTMPVLVFDSECRLTLANTAAEQLLELNTDIIEKQKIVIEDLFAVDENAVIFDPGKERHDVDSICKHNDMKCLLAVNLIRDRYGEVNGYNVIIFDQTEQINQMKQIQKAHDEAEKARAESEKSRIDAEAANMAKSAFLANMSHEIRTPMNSISGFSELMLKMDDVPETAKHYAEDIRDSAHNLLAIINDILDLSKLESGHMELVERKYFISRIFQDIYSTNKQMAEHKDLKLIMNIDPSIPEKLYGDNTKIRSIIMNLMSNAVKYTAEGSVEFRATLVNKSEDSATFEFAITDTGSGIKEEDIDRLFNSFEQVNVKLHEGIEGTGLGLSIVKGYVDLMGGKILVNSTYGKGSEFKVILTQKIVCGKPIGEFTTTTKNGGTSKIGSLKISDTKVLVVDDNKVNLRVAAATLNMYGLEVDMAQSGAESIEKCKNTEYDLVFMDQMMPEMDGIEAMKTIRTISDCYSQGGKSKIIVLTANAISGARDELLSVGFDEYLGKPMNYSRLEYLLRLFIPENRIS